MATQRHSYLSRSHLLRMATFAQRAVDYSIKSYELGVSETHRLFLKHDQEWRNLQRCIAIRGRTLFVAGMLVDGDSLKGDCAMRIYSALQVTYTAAAEIVHSAALMVELEQRPPSPQLGELGRFVNGLVRLCTVALFKKEVQHARQILLNHRGRRWFELTLCHIRCLPAGNSVAQARFELAIADALEQIAEQAYEIARALSSSPPDEDDRLDAAREIPRFACGGHEKDIGAPCLGGRFAAF